MSLADAKPLAQCLTPVEALDELCSSLQGYRAFGCDGRTVSPEQMPADYRRLLVHERHMTLVLKEFHGCRLDLYVMQAHRDGDLYTRKIFLTRSGTGDAVELGVVRLDLRLLPAPARHEILSQHAPLGAVLIRHRILRRIEPRWYLRFERGCGMLAWFGRPADGPFYGRIGTIWCDGAPAVEVMEIATLWNQSETHSHERDV